MNAPETLVHLLPVPGPDALVNAGFGHGKTPFGPAVLVWADGGVLSLWLDESDSEPALSNARARHHIEVTRRDDAFAQDRLNRIFAQTDESPLEEPVSVVVRASPFELAVWQALCRIPSGCVVTYGELARTIGRPGAARAVGSAVARNGVAYLIPCHRVVPGSGMPGKFRWGVHTKQRLLEWENGAR